MHQLDQIISQRIAICGGLKSYNLKKGEKQPADQTWISPKYKLIRWLAQIEVLPKWETLCASKILDLLSHNINTPIIRCIQLQNHIVVLCSIELACHSKNGWSFASARRAVQQEVWQSVLTSEPINYLIPPQKNKMNESITKQLKGG